MNFPNGNGKEIATTRMVLFLFVVAMLAHLCSYQLAHGAEEKFVPGSGRFSRGVSIEMRGESAVVGDEIRLRNIARWSDADKDVLDPIGDLIVARLGSGNGFRTISINEIKGLLRDAGVNIATVNFAGPMSCTVSRTDVSFDQGAALEQWATAKEVSDKSPVKFADTPPATTQRAKIDRTPVAQVADNPYRSLRDIIEGEYAQRIGVPRELLQITFRQQDEKMLRLTEPHFQFDVQPQRASNLGDVSWNVNVQSEGATNRIFVQASAKAWQQQVVIAKPLATKQMITDQDVTERRTLTDNLTDDPLLRRDQIVGQMAARNLRPGTVVTAKLVDAVQMVRTGQFVTVQSAQGGINIKTVARAIDSGSYGQSVRVKNETTKDIYRVIVTGMQEASLNAPEVVAVTE